MLILLLQIISGLRIGGYGCMGTRSQISSHGFSSGGQDVFQKLLDLDYSRQNLAMSSID